MTTPVIVLSFSAVQTAVAQKLTAFLGDRLGTEVRIGKFQLKFPATFVASSLYIKDLNDEKLAEIDRISTHISLFALLNKEIKLTSTHIDNLAANITLDSTGVPNFQFIIEAFKTDKKAATPNLAFNNVVISNARLAYRDTRCGAAAGPGRFDPHHICIDSIDTHFNLSILDNASKIDADIRSLSFNEKGGFAVDDMTSAITLADKNLTVKHLNVILPHSNINVSNSIATIPANIKDSISDLKIDLHLNQSIIYLPDLASFYPDLSQLRSSVSLSVHLFGQPDLMQAKQLSVDYGDQISLLADIDANNLDKISDAFFLCDIAHITFDRSSVDEIVTAISHNKAPIPESLERLGTCTYRGKLSGSTSNAVVYGALATNIGSVRTDASVRLAKDMKEVSVDGRISSDGLKLNELLPGSGLGLVSFNSNSRVSIDRKKRIDADIKIIVDQFTFQDYAYNNIEVNGQLKNNRFIGNALLDDDNGYFLFNGEVTNSPDSLTANFAASLRHANLHRLKLTDKYPAMDLSATIRSEFAGAGINSLIGYINIDSLTINNSDKQFVINNLDIVTENEGASSITITSDIINGGIEGNYSAQALYRQITKTLTNDMPVLRKFVNTEDTAKNGNTVTFSFNIEPLKPLLTTLEIPWHTTQNTSFVGHYDDSRQLFYSTLTAPGVSNGKQSIDSLTVVINNFDGITVSANTIMTTKSKDKQNARLRLKAKNDIITTNLTFSNSNPANIYSGEIALSTELYGMYSKQTEIVNTILPTELMLNNRLWEINRSKVNFHDNRLDIDGFSIRSEDNQFININGTASTDSIDEILISLKDISLDYISELIPETTPISFGGLVSGSASVKQAFSKYPELRADVVSDNLYFDNGYFGHLHATCDYDLSQKAILWNGTVTADNNDTTANIQGGYWIALDSLDLTAQTDSLDIGFINYYLADIFGTVKGLAYGNLHVHGITKKKTVAVDVDAYARNASVFIDFLNTEYFFSDTIHVDSHRIDFGTIDIYDSEGHHGVLTGGLTHSYFDNVMLNIGLKLDNMLAMNTDKDQSESFYGRIYGSGDVLIQSPNPDLIRISAKAITNKNTRLVIPIDNYSAGDNQFITFTSTRTAKDEAEEEDSAPADTNLQLDIMVEATPDAELLLIIDSQTGDMLRANGSGNLRMTYDINADDLKLYGGYQLNEGQYLFTFQNIIRKEFHIKEGSSINWTGDMLGATIDIDAYYQLNADLATLLEGNSILDNMTRTSAPVRCLLNMSGQLMQPKLQFDLNLPNSDEELNRAMKDAVNTEEQMNRQIVGLLLMGKFISPETLQNNNIISQNELYSVVSSTLSAQLNNWASQMFNNWDFGVNFRTQGEGETRTNEYEFNFLYSSPNKKFSINGNVGYRDDALSQNNFIGDFDFEYKLIQSGKLRLKAYTHTNDYREFKKSLTTQGIGLIYSESFYDAASLWRSWQENMQQNRQERQQAKQKRYLKRQQKKDARAKAKEQKRERKEEEKREGTKQLQKSQ